MAKTVLITGASSGIGRETALLFRERGWNVAATMRHPEGRATGLEGTGIEPLHLDVTERDSIQQGFQAVLRRFGSLDVLVNNAGYAIRGAFEASEPEKVRKQFDTNVLGLMEMTRQVLPHFRERGAGVVVNLSSIGGRVAFPYYGVYNSTKFAVEGFSEALRYELAQFNIRVKLIEPGLINTDFYGRSMAEAGLAIREVYEKHLMRSKQAMAGPESRGSHPRLIAQLIYRAATDGSGRLRYHAGNTSGLILAMRRMLPDRLFLALIRAFSG